MKINLVIDNPNSWFNAPAVKLKKSLTSMGNICLIVNDPRKIKPKSDITFFLSCEQYITPKTRNKSLHNIVVHASNLPKGKGMSPTTWQILEGENTIPLTLFEVADKIDAGDYYLKASFRLNGSELIAEWQEKLAQNIFQLIFKFVKNFKKLPAKKQTEKTTYYPRRTISDSALDPHKTIAEQFNLLRVVDNEKYPAYFIFKKNKYIIKIYKDQKKWMNS
ncbi:MAG: methionyl-tRNA formyltransferase [Patescibacteria group bacterium]|jgi:methionyl-tRNA formyltransferase